MKEQIALGRAVLREDDGTLFGPAGSAHLTPQERAVLGAIAQASGRPVTNERLLDVLWGNRPDGPQPNMVTVLICRVRQALTDVGAGPVIRTVRGIGYRLETRDGDTAPVLLDGRRVRLLEEVLKVAARVEPALVQEFIRA